jgi:hypothetical protein
VITLAQLRLVGPRAEIDELIEAMKVGAVRVTNVSHRGKSRKEPTHELLDASVELLLIQDRPRRVTRPAPTRRTAL